MTVHSYIAPGDQDRGLQNVPAWLSHSHTAWRDRSLRGIGGFFEHRLAHACLMPRSRRLLNLELVKGGGT